MNIKDLIKYANETLCLPIDWDNVSGDENYKQLFACTRLVLNSLNGLWTLQDTTRIFPEDMKVDYSTLIYGILAEYAFVAGMFNEWKVWQEKYKSGLFKARNGKARFIPVQ